MAPGSKGPLNGEGRTSGRYLVKVPLQGGTLRSPPHTYVAGQGPRWGGGGRPPRRPKVQGGVAGGDYSGVSRGTLGRFYRVSTGHERERRCHMRGGCARRSRWHDGTEWHLSAAGRGYRCRYLPSRPAGARVRCSGHRAHTCASATANVRHAWLHCVPPVGKARMSSLDGGIRAVHARLGRFCGCVWRCAVCTRAT